MKKIKRYGTDGYPREDGLFVEWVDYAELLGLIRKLKKKLKEKNNER